MRRRTIRKITVNFVTAFMVFSMTNSVVGQHNHTGKSSTPLTMPGNEVFGTIQEVVQKLEADPDTDWSEVDLEALRQHLLDMKAFTEEVEVLSKKPVENGVKIQVRPKSKQAVGALKRLFSMHPAMLKKEKGWEMKTQKQGKQWTIICTTDEQTEVDRIRALGYIGLLAEGAHHQRHHWMIATGEMNME
ncbi:MAG: hypothetical protein ACLFM7_14565 [Bacteroidales bacterium]